MSDIDDYKLLRIDYIRFAPETPLEEATANLLTASRSEVVFPIGAIVSAEGRFLGFFTLKKALEAMPQKGGGATGKSVLDLATAGIPFVTAESSIAQVIETLTTSGLGAVPVITNGVLQGLIFVTDVFDQLCEVALIETTQFAPSR
ncbi:MAG: CBS domain-containing protein [Candidatus Sumerlaeota bacterium]|nr:CBS domain-containing protein [Candidatus Sumerlaeota bacterium]